MQKILKTMLVCMLLMACESNFVPQKGPKGDPGVDGRDAPTMKEITNALLNDDQFFDGLLVYVLANPNFKAQLKGAKGDTGDKGDQGDPGIAPTLEDVTTNLVEHYNIAQEVKDLLHQDPAFMIQAQGPKGDKGDEGKAPSLVEVVTELIAIQKVDELIAGQLANNPAFMQAITGPAGNNARCSKTGETIVVPSTIQENGGIQVTWVHASCTQEYPCVVQKGCYGTNAANVGLEVNETDEGIDTVGCGFQRFKNEFHVASVQIVCAQDLSDLKE